jgi:hypothetical protein
VAELAEVTELAGARDVAGATGVLAPEPAVQPPVEAWGSPESQAIPSRL